MLTSREAELQEEADLLTSRLPHGTPVRYWPGPVNGDESQPATIEGPFFVLGGHTVVVRLAGRRACFAADHVTAAEPLKE